MIAVVARSSRRRSCATAKARPSSSPSRSRAARRSRVPPGRLRDRPLAAGQDGVLRERPEPRPHPRGGRLRRHRRPRPDDDRPVPRRRARRRRRRPPSRLPRGRRPARDEAERDHGARRPAPRRRQRRRCGPATSATTTSRSTPTTAADRASATWTPRNDARNNARLALAGARLAATMPLLISKARPDEPMRNPPHQRSQRIGARWSSWRIGLRLGVAAHAAAAAHRAAAPHPSPLSARFDRSSAEKSAEEPIDSSFLRCIGSTRPAQAASIEARRRKNERGEPP